MEYQKKIILENTSEDISLKKKAKLNNLAFINKIVKNQAHV